MWTTVVVWPKESLNYGWLRTTVAVEAGQRRCRVLGRKSFTKGFVSATADSSTEEVHCMVSVSGRVHDWAISVFTSFCSISWVQPGAPSVRAGWHIRI